MTERQHYHLQFAQDLFWRQPKFEGSRFHWRDDIYFIRKSDLSVTVIRVTFHPETNSSEEAAFDPTIHFEFNVPSLEWCSIIASMSKGRGNS